MLPIDEPTRQRIRASFAPFLAERERFANAFYARLFAAAPSVRALFPDDQSAQRRKFVDMLVVAIDAAVGGPSLRLFEELGARHVAYGAKAEHYPLVHEALVATLRGESASFDAETEQAWQVLLRHVVGAMLRGASQSTEGSAPLQLLVHRATPAGRWSVRDDAAGRVLYEHESRAEAEAAAIRLADAASRSGRVTTLLFQHDDGAVVRFKIGE